MVVGVAANYTTTAEVFNVQTEKYGIINEK
jgi:hypothetical protein